MKIYAMSDIHGSPMEFESGAILCQTCRSSFRIHIRQEFLSSWWRMIER